MPAGRKAAFKWPPHSRLPLATEALIRHAPGPAVLLALPTMQRKGRQSPHASLNAGSSFAQFPPKAEVRGCAWRYSSSARSSWIPRRAHCSAMGFRRLWRRRHSTYCCACRATGTGRLEGRITAGAVAGNLRRGGEPQSADLPAAKILDGDDHPRYIATVPRRGYRFVAEVRERSEEPGLFLGRHGRAIRSPAALATSLVSAC